MLKSKQVIILRKDLNMRKGKMVAQGAHASQLAIHNAYVTDMKVDTTAVTGSYHSSYLDWIQGKFTKIVVSVDTEQELLDIYRQANDAGLPCSLITDSGATEFNDVPTKTAVAIGPCWDHQVDPITTHLKLL